jgi:hypothetical protein
MLSKFLHMFQQILRKIIKIDNSIDLLPKFTVNSMLNFVYGPCVYMYCTGCKELSTREVSVRDGHGGGWSRKINAWHLYTLMVYL